MTPAMTRRSPRVVLDSNVLISAGLRPDGASRRVVEWVIRNGVLLGSRETFGEFAPRYLTRKRFEKYGTAEERAAFAEAVRLNTQFVEVSSSATASPDPDDNAFLALAADGAADFLVTGNTKDFPESYRGTPVVTPAQFRALHGID